MVWNWDKSQLEQNIKNLIDKFRNFSHDTITLMDTEVVSGKTTGGTSI